METDKSSSTYIGTFYQSNKYFNLGLPTKETVDEEIFGALDQINLCFYVLVRSPLGDTRNILTKNEKNTEGEVRCGLHQNEV